MEPGFVKECLYSRADMHADLCQLARNDRCEMGSTCKANSCGFFYDRRTVALDTSEPF